MKKIIVFLSIFISVVSSAQHLPLKNITLPNTHTYQIREWEFNNVYYASYALGSRHISYDKDIDNLCISINLSYQEDKLINNLTTMEVFYKDFMIGHGTFILCIGEKNYRITSWNYNRGTQSLMIDISADIAKHIAISGLQSIYITDKSNCLINDGEHNQEAWRRCANKLLQKYR